MQTQREAGRLWCVYILPPVQHQLEGTDRGVIQSCQQRSTMLYTYQSTLRTCRPMEILRPYQKNQARKFQTHQTNEGFKKPPHLNPTKSRTPNARLAPPTCYLNTQCVCQGTENASLSLRLQLNLSPLLGMAHLEFLFTCPFIYLSVCLSICT